MATCLLPAATYKVSAHDYFSSWHACFRKVYVCSILQPNVVLNCLNRCLPGVTDGTEKSCRRLQSCQAKTLVASETAMEDARGVWDQLRARVLPSDDYDKRRHACFHSEQYGHTRPGEELQATGWVIHITHFRHKFTHQHLTFCTGYTHSWAVQGRRNSNPWGKCLFPPEILQFLKLHLVFRPG